MREILNYAKYGFIVGITYAAGYWLWEEVLADKMDDLKNRITKTE